MLNLSNKCDVSGMFSKAGRVSYERYHILHKKGDILAANPSDLFSYYEREPSTDAWTGANEFH